jgi:hypothetical protein
MLLYEFNELRNDGVRKGNLKKSIDNLKARLAERNELANADNLGETGFFKWRLRDQYRLIGRLKSIQAGKNRVDVLFFCALLHRNSAAYNQTINHNTNLFNNTDLEISKINLDILNLVNKDIPSDEIEILKKLRIGCGRAVSFGMT